MPWPDFAGVVLNEFHIYEDEKDWVLIGWRVVQ